MCRLLSCLTPAFLVVGLMATTSYGQLGVYEFDGGGDGTSWNNAANWSEVLLPDGTPGGLGDPVTPPDGITTADIPLAGVVSSAVGNTALDVNIGTATGAGGLEVSGGDLTTGRDVFVGDAVNTGSLTVSGGLLDVGDDITVGNGPAGTVLVNGGSVTTNDDFSINANSSLTMTGGTVNVGDRLIMEDNASLVLHGGNIVADDDFYFFGDSQITVNGGSMIVKDKLRFDSDLANNGKVTINSGLVRSSDFQLDIVDPLTDFRGVVEINGDGRYEAENKSGTLANLDVATAQLLIDQGTHFITSDPGPRFLAATSITLGIGEFFENTVPLTFTRISLVPEPSSILLLGLGGLGLLIRRKQN